MLVVPECEQLPVPQARAGDAAAWDALFQRYQLPLYACIFELVREEQETICGKLRQIEPVLTGMLESGQGIPINEGIPALP